MRHLLLSLSLVLAAPSVAIAGDKEDCVTAADKGQALRRDRKLSAARDQFVACARDVCPTIVRKQCADWLSEVDASMPTVVFSAKDPQGKDVVAVRVSVDGATVSKSLDGRAIAIEPGPHTFKLEADGMKPFEQQLLIREGEKNRAITVDLKPATEPKTEPKPEPKTEPAPEPKPEPLSSAPPDTSSKGSGTGQKIAGITVAVAGAVGIGVGIGFGAMASSKWNDAKTTCGTGCATNSPAYALRDDASTAATVSTVAIVVGAIAVAGGAALFFLAPKSKTSVAFGPGIVAGTF